MKRYIAFVMVLVCLFVMMPAVSAASGFDNFTKAREYTSELFSDVEADSWYEKHVIGAYEIGLMLGAEGDLFKPDGQMSIAETVTIASRLHSIYHTGTEIFEQGEVWYQVYADYALENGILKSAPESYTKTASRTEFAAILAAALPDEALPAINIVDDGMVPDVPIGAEHYDDIYKLYRAGVLTGSDNKGTFMPTDSIGRSSAAAIITRMAKPEMRESLELIRPVITGTPIGESDVKWSFDGATGVLTLAGFGTFAASDTSWEEYKGNIKHIVIGEGITEIPDGCFEGLKGVVSVSLPTSLSKIGESAFEGCVLLSRVDMSKTRVAEIGDRAFGYCPITALALPDTLISIGKSTFSYSHLDKVIIPAAVTYIGESAFRGTSEHHLSSVYFLGNDLPELGADISGAYTAFSYTRDIYDMSMYISSSTFYNAGLYLPNGAPTLESQKNGGQYAMYSAHIKNYNTAALDRTLPAEVPVETISLSKTKLTLYKGGTYDLDAVLGPADTTQSGVSWTSSDPWYVQVAGVDGQIKADNTGSSVPIVITATAANGKTATCEVTVLSDDSIDVSYYANDTVTYIKDHLKVPSSFGLISINAGIYHREYCDYPSTGTYVAVITHFQGMNSYGSMVTDYMVTLYDLNTGETVRDMESCYNALADRSYGAAKTKYTSFESEALSLEINAKAFTSYVHLFQ